MIYVVVGLLVLLALLQVGDGVTTYLVLRRGGSELNPLERWLLQCIGTVGCLVASKACAVVLACLASWLYYGSYPLWVTICLIFVDLVYIGVLCNNYSQYRKQIQNGGGAD